MPLNIVRDDQRQISFDGGEGWGRGDRNFRWPMGQQRFQEHFASGPLSFQPVGGHNFWRQESNMAKRTILPVEIRSRG